MKQIAVFGGSFNPPLNSHFSIAEQIINEISTVEKVIFLPVSNLYEKQGLESNENRYNMLKLVTDKNEKFLLSDLELSYKDRQLLTVETLRLLQQEYKEYELLFIIGTDNLEELPTWYKANELLNEFRLIVVNRDSDVFEKIINSNEFLEKYRNRFIELKGINISTMSSTFVRKKLKNNESVRYLLPDEVNEYVKSNNLYN